MGYTGFAGFFLSVVEFGCLSSIKSQVMLLEFVLFSRSNCPLCEAMEDELRPFIKKYSITVNRQYIDNDAVLEQKYGTKVPVLTRSQITLCEYFLDPEPLLDEIAKGD